MEKLLFVVQNQQDQRSEAIPHIHTGQQSRMDDCAANTDCVCNS